MSSVLDLFSGVGGLGLGFRLAGFNVVGVELDRKRAIVYSRNVGKSITGDVRDVDFSGFRGFDVVAAGPPCRPYSVATPRRRRGPAHPEYGLDMEVARAVEEVRPAAVVVEEVPAWRPDALVAALSRLGYRVAHRLVWFGDYGVPTLRSRWVVVALRDSDPAGVFNALDSLREAPPRPIDLLSDLPSQPCSENPCMANGRAIYDHVTYNINSRIAELIPKIPPGHSLVTAHRAGLVDASRYVKDIAKKHRYWLYRIPLDRPMKVVPHPRRSMVLHPIHNRMLTVRELARLMTFPDDFVFAPLTVDAAMRAIADAVPPKFAHKLAAILKQTLR